MSIRFVELGAPPPPLISQPEGATWSAPSIKVESIERVEREHVQPELERNLLGARRGCDVGDESHALRSRTRITAA
jgi:hypothetical protein